ncbi:hypothetical protein BN946_scf184958.g1 [Trametes cinnabarina]|uniref:Ubiquinol-cytochrome c chaperone domain-containing protein n=1 Tax=Pycnoporus cinnabarinus TaxID=5643 RepID=A0A060SRY1_PYCCI|nr:hypothetical protein BN946_scf184958.g1 [Trametes cinnabarina]
MLRSPHPRLRLPRSALPTPAPYVRSLTSQQQPPPSPPPSSSPEPAREPPPPPPQTWLTKAIKQSPAAKEVFLTLAGLLGYGSAKQYAGRRAFNMYSHICISRPDEEAAFWKQDCHLPPTFQSWFTVTNLHVWLLTVRLRALPPPQGQNFVQALIDHFFLDVEDRVRAVLQPVGEKSLAPAQNLAPYTRRTDFYTIANGGNTRSSRAPRGRAPESLVTRQMKIFKEQWAGMGMSFDLGLVRSDAELAAAVWRNLLGARGARGIAYENDPSRPYFRRTVNLFGSQVEKLSKIQKRGGIEAEERRDDGSGVHDFPPSEVDKYVAYPETMATIVEYVRRELVRLQDIPDAVFLGEGVIGTENHGLEVLRFGPVKRPDSLTASFAREEPEQGS